MVSIHGSKTPSWKPMDMEVGPPEGHCGPGLLPGTQERPILVPDLLLTPQWSGEGEKTSQHSLCSKMRLMTSGHSTEALRLRQCRNWAAYLKCPTSLHFWFNHLFPIPLVEEINILGREGKINSSASFWYAIPAVALGPRGGSSSHGAWAGPPFAGHCTLAAWSWCSHGDRRSALSHIFWQISSPKNSQNVSSRCPLEIHLVPCCCHFSNIFSPVNIFF